DSILNPLDQINGRVGMEWERSRKLHSTAGDTNGYRQHFSVVIIWAGCWISPSHQNHDARLGTRNVLKTSLKLILFFALAVLGTAQPATDHSAVTPRQLVERHVKGMQTGNPDMAVEPYADDAVVMTPPGAFPPGTKSLEPGIAIGKANIRKFFASLLNADHGVAAKGM